MTRREWITVLGIAKQSSLIAVLVVAEWRIVATLQCELHDRIGAVLVNGDYSRTRVRVR